VSIAEEIAGLRDLRDQGALSEEEFSAAKAKLLGATQRTDASDMQPATGSPREASASKERERPPPSRFATHPVLILLGFIGASAAGLALLSDLPKSPEDAQRAAAQSEMERAAGQRDVFGNPRNRSLSGAVDAYLEGATAALDTRFENQRRAERRQYEILALAVSVVCLGAGVALKRRS
jgi:hypothetical protein